MVKVLFEVLPSIVDTCFLEPSAGTGNFIQSLIKFGIPEKRIKGIDIDPKFSKIKKVDYLKTKYKFNRKRTIIGNPPFGNRGGLALTFLNKALSQAPVVAMIFPNTFNRFMIHKNVIEGAKLIYSEQLSENSFILHDREYGVKCVFQIWVTWDFYTFESNKRLLTPPDNKHDDFKTFIYNNTKETLKYFDKAHYKWDFAVVRQGYYDYTKLITDPKELIPKRQYFFIKSNNAVAKKIIKKIDFTKLAQNNTQVPGFSTTDFVTEYKKQKNNYLERKRND